MIYNNKYAVHLAKWEKEPYVLMPNGVCRFETKHYSKLAVNDDFKFPESKTHILLRTSEGNIIHARYKHGGKINKKAKVKKIAVIRDYYCDKIVSSKCQYILHYRRKDEEAKIIQIWPSGVMSDSLLEKDIETGSYSSFNGIPANVLQSIQMLSDFFKKIFEPFEMDFVQLHERRIDKNGDPTYSIDDMEEVTYKKLISTSFSTSQSGFREEVIS